MDYLLLLSVPVSLFSLLNKIFLVLHKRSGWTWGAVVGITSAIYFFLIGLHILAVAEVGFFVVMIYGYINHSSNSKRFSLHTNIILTLISVLLGIFLFTNYLTVVETISSLSFIWGGYLLASKKVSLGWLLFIVAHIATAISALDKGETVFSILQITSAFICCYGLYTVLKDK
jgi:hypothetical protein